MVASLMPSMTAKPMECEFKRFCTKSRPESPGILTIFLEIFSRHLSLVKILETVKIVNILSCVRLRKDASLVIRTLALFILLDLLSEKSTLLRTNLLSVLVKSQSLPNFYWEKRTRIKKMTLSLLKSATNSTGHKVKINKMAAYLHNSKS